MASTLPKALMSGLSVALKPSFCSASTVANRRALHVAFVELSKSGLYPAASVGSLLQTKSLSQPLQQVTFRLQSTDAPKDAEKPAAEGEAQAEADSGVSEAEAKLQNEIKELQEKNDDLMDRYRRSIAESDNMRKRLTKQIDDAKIFGIQGFCKDLLEVADVLNTAIGGVGEDVLAKESSYLRDMHQGLQLTENQLHQVFKRHGLEQDNPLNEKFDPNRHEALFQIPNGEVDPNTVLDVQKVGYLLHGRTIRPAKVGVSRKP